MIEKSFTDTSNNLRGYEIYKYEVDSLNSKDLNPFARDNSYEPGNLNKDYEQADQKPSNDIPALKYDYLIPVIQLDNIPVFNAEQNKELSENQGIIVNFLMYSLSYPILVFQCEEMENLDFDLQMAPENPTDNMIPAESNVLQEKVVSDQLATVQNASQFNSVTESSLSNEITEDDEEPSSALNGFLSKLRDIFVNSFFNFRGNLLQTCVFDKLITSL